MVTPDTAISPILTANSWDAMWFGNNAATPILQLSNWFYPGGVWSNYVKLTDTQLVDTKRLLDEAGASTSAVVIKEKLAAVEKIAWELSTFIPIGTRFYVSGTNYAPGLVQALMPGQLQFVVTTYPELPLD